MMALCTTRRIGISAFSLSELNSTTLSPSGEVFTVCALGKDSELIDNLFVSKIRNNRERIKVLVPDIPTPAGLVESLGYGLGRRVLFPVPLVVGLEEPPVVPNFLRDLETKGGSGRDAEEFGEMDLNWGPVLRENPGMVVAAHGPVTTAGAKSLGVDVNVLSSRFGSFDGVVLL
ncbi:hypothetical protein L1887_32789 [Cichorium endivia]|nr:hypothetical protein L1887_32789 [Cichorium endivia]